MQEADKVDLLVVGGGIHGAGVTQAAAAAGYSVTLVEQREIAFGTSSRSSKLIHGGLRYLEQGSFALVRESLREREILLRLAPALVKRIPFFIPIYAQTRRRPTAVRIGLTLYSMLAGGRAGARFRSVPADEWTELDGLTTTGLSNVFQYWDAQTDDRALTEAVIDSAVELGAEVLCPAAFDRAEITENSCRAWVTVAGESRCLQANAIVNAGGPWANEVLSRVAPTMAPMPVECVQGTHLELPGPIDHGCYYVEAADGRAVFVMPWKGRTLLGTTEHVYTGDPAAVHPLDTEIKYLLSVYQQYFPRRDPTVLDAWAGLRVLPARGTAFARSRETQLPVDNPRLPRLLSVFGGKLTGYRATAIKVMHKLRPSLPARRRRASTDELPLRPRSL